MSLLNEEKAIVSEIPGTTRDAIEDTIVIEGIPFRFIDTAGIRKKLGGVILRNVPSAGNRHAIETYLFITNVEGIEPGIYRYLPIEHADHAVNAQHVRPAILLPDIDGPACMPIVAAPPRVSPWHWWPLSC